METHMDTKTKKLHWTQRPENKAKVLAMSKRGQKTRSKMKGKSKAEVIVKKAIAKKKQTLGEAWHEGSRLKLYKQAARVAVSAGEHGMLVNEVASLYFFKHFGGI
jgi:hypothetical protein